MDLDNVDIKIDNEDQTLIILYSPLSFYETFINTLLYENVSILLDDISIALILKDLKINFSEYRTEWESLVNRGRAQIKARSKSSGKKINYFKCDE